MIDKQILIFQRSNYQKHVLRKSKSLKINDINSSSLFINEYIAMNFVIFDEIDEASTKVCFTRYVHIINNFKINIFLNNDIFDSKDIVIHVDKQKFIVDNCDNFTTSLKIIIKNDDDERVKRIIRFQFNYTISTHFCSFIFIKYREFKLSNRDMMFNSNDLKRLRKKNDVFFHLMNVNFSFVQMRNIIDQLIIICKNERLNVLIEYEKKNCYLINSKNRHLTVDFWTKKVLKIDVMTLTAFQSFTFMSSSSFVVNQSVVSTTFVSTIFVFAFSQKYVINIDIIVYDTSKVVEIIISMTKVFFNFWQDDDFVVNLFSKKWMFIDLKSNVKSMLFKIYSFDQADKDFIDQEFDKL